MSHKDTVRPLGPTRTAARSQTRPQGRGGRAAQPPSPQQHASSPMPASSPLRRTGPFGLRDVWLFNQETPAPTVPRCARAAPERLGRAGRSLGGDCRGCPCNSPGLASLQTPATRTSSSPDVTRVARLAWAHSQSKDGKAQASSGPCPGPQTAASCPSAASQPDHAAQ